MSTTRRDFLKLATKAMLAAPFVLGAPHIWVPRSFAQASATPAFIGAQGFGATCQHARNPSARILFVTNLNDSGPGSFRQQYVVETGPRYIIFSVGGYIPILGTNFAHSLLNPNGNVYVAGQTAPGDGITFKGQTTGNADGFYVQGSHTCARFIRSRAHANTGTNSWALAGWRGGGMQHSIIDHCSGSFATDDSFACNHDLFTIQRSLISEGLSFSGFHARAMFYDSKNGATFYTFHHNAMLHAGVQRFPAFGSGQGGESINNLAYNWGGGGVGDGAYYHNVFAVQPNPKYDVINNYFKWGPTSDEGGNRNPATVREIKHGYPPGSIFLSGNKALCPTPTGFVPARVGTHPSSGLTIMGTKQLTPTFPVTVDDLSTQALADAWANSLLANVGCTKPVRDGIDQAVIASYNAFTGTSITAHENQCLYALAHGGNPWQPLNSGTPQNLQPSGMTQNFITRMGLSNTVASALSTSISQSMGNVYQGINVTGMQNIEWNLMEQAGDIAPLGTSDTTPPSAPSNIRISRL